LRKPSQGPIGLLRPYDVGSGDALPPDPAITRKNPGREVRDFHYPGPEFRRMFALSLKLA